MATEIYKTNDLAFANRLSFAFSDKLPYGNYGFVTAPYGEYWGFIKKLSMTKLFCAQQLEQSRAIRHEEISRFLLKALESAKKKQAFNVGAELIKITNNSTCKLLMSLRCSDEHDEGERIRQFVKESSKLGAKICFGDVLGPLRILAYWLYGKKVIDLNLEYDAILERVLKQHEESPQKENEDLMDMLLKIYEDDNAEFKLTRTHIKAFLAVSNKLVVFFL